MVYTDEQKAEAVRLYVEVGPEEAAKTIGCSRRAVYNWLGLHGVQAKKPDEQRAETELRHTAKREALREALLDAALTGAAALDTSDPKGFQSLAVGVGILLDKYRLERGEHTDRTQVVTLGLVERELERLEAQVGAARNS
jgi:transposase-like protein